MKCATRSHASDSITVERRALSPPDVRRDCDGGLRARRSTGAARAVAECFRGSLQRMPNGSRTWLTLTAVLVVAPVGAVVVIGALLLFGVTPHFVFMPGFFVKSGLERFGLHPPKPVAVISTAVAWWVVVLAVWLGVRRLWNRDA
jgi:hypothetical protein